MPKELNLSPHLLVIDDDVDILKGLATILEKQGYRITALSDPRQGGEILKNDPVDLVISDVVMPEMDGMEVLEKAKAQDPTIEVILITAHADLEKAFKFMQRGAFDYIAKPFRAEELIHRVHKALEQRQLKRKIVELHEAQNAAGKSHEKQLQADKLTSLSRLVSGMAHEINNPLTAVIGYSQLLLDSGGQDMNRQLAVIRDQATRCGKIIQDLLIFARKRKPQLHPIKFNELISAAVEMARGQFDPLQIQVIQVYSSDDIEMRGDSTQLQKVFTHILSNAIHALETKTGKRKIEVRVTEENEMIDVLISDNGCGIAPEHLNRLYEPFFTTKEVGKGSGLGLSLCYGFVAEHGGTISVNSVLGEGSKFLVRLPKAGVSKPAVAAPIKKDILSSASKTVLVVEDETVVAGFVEKILTDHGYEVSLAHDGEIGRRMILEKPYDLILCDYRIPKIDGFELYQRVAKERPHIGEHFIFVTASLHFAQDHGGEEFLNKNGLSYLQKPFTATELLDLVGKRLRSAA